MQLNAVSMQLNAVACSSMQWHAAQCSDMQLNAVACSSMQWHAAQCSEHAAHCIQLNAVACSSMQWHAAQCSGMQLNANGSNVHKYTLSNYHNEVSFDKNN